MEGNIQKISHLLQLNIQHYSKRQSYLRSKIILSAHILFIIYLAVFLISDTICKSSLSFSNYILSIHKLNSIMIKIYHEFIHVNLVNFKIIARTSVCIPIHLTLIITLSMIYVHITRCPPSRHINYSLMQWFNASDGSVIFTLFQML